LSGLLCSIYRTDLSQASFQHHSEVFNIPAPFRLTSIYWTAIGHLPSCHLAGHARTIAAICGTSGQRSRNDGVDLDTENSSWSNLPVETELSADEAALGLPDPIGPSPGDGPLESAQP
jgi:hypothetical protein